MSTKAEPTFLTSLISGGFAGTSVDVALFPLDTIKTRLQSSQGFIKAGGFRGVYAGLSVAVFAPGWTLECAAPAAASDDEKTAVDARFWASLDAERVRRG